MSSHNLVTVNSQTKFEQLFIKHEDDSLSWAKVKTEPQVS
jgi:hypothetical protein